MKANILLCFLFVSIIVSCDINKNDADPANSFTRIYEDVNYSIEYYPVDVKESADGGYVVLSAIKRLNDLSNYPNIHILKVDKLGNYEWDYVLGENNQVQYSSPVPDLMNINGSLHFVAMDDNTLEASLFRIEISTAENPIQHVKELGFRLPLNSFYNGRDEMLTQSYDFNSYESILTRFDRNLNESYSIRVPSGENFFDKIGSHLDKTGWQYPLFIREDTRPDGSNHYMMNGFAGYTLSLLFLDAGSNQFSGRINGFQESGGISALTSLPDGKLFLSRYHENKNYVSPFHDIDRSQTVNASEFTDQHLPELKENAPSMAIHEQFKEKELTVYATTGKNNQLILNFYDPIAEELIETKYIGHTNPIELSNIFKTTDEGIAIVATTWVAGRYQRIMLIKLSPDELPI